MEDRQSIIDTINCNILSQIPKERLDHVFSHGDIDGEFIGFVEQYDALSRLIPKHFTIVDIGCAYAPQAYLFRNHAKYMAIDATTALEDTFIDLTALPNTQHFHTDAAAFIDLVADTLDLDTTFAICSYVPPWYGDIRRLVGATFPNSFTFYPAGDVQPKLQRKI